MAPAPAPAARTLLPSIQNKSQSIFPSRSSRMCRASRIRSKVPFDRPLLKDAYAVCQGPKRSGTSGHGAPVRKIHNTPLSNCRASRRGRPVSAGFTWTSGLMSFHCSSVSSCRCAIVDPPSRYKRDRHNYVFFRQNLVPRAFRRVPWRCSSVPRPEPARTSPSHRDASHRELCRIRHICKPAPSERSGIPRLPGASCARVAICERFIEPELLPPLHFCRARLSVNVNP